MVLRSAGAIAPLWTLPSLAAIVRTSGRASTPNILARLHGDRTAVIDDEGELSYRDLARFSNAAVNALRVLPDSGRQPAVGLMCRNSRYAVYAMFGALGAGAKLALLNSDLGPKQLAEVCRREQLDAVVCDEDFVDRFALVHDDVKLLIAGPGDATSGRDFAALLRRTSSSSPPTPKRNAAIVILTSGSTGMPKGVLREPGRQKPTLTTLGGFLQKIPLRRTDRILLAPPMFHGWGLMVLTAGLMTGATVVVQREFDEGRAVDALVAHRCTALIAVPTMLRRLIALGPEQLDRIDRSQLRLIASGGARLDTTLVDDILGSFGPVLHNLYGTTEAAYITIATPEDLTDKPSCAGRAPIGVEVAIVRSGRRRAAGEVGQIYARTGSQMASYTDDAGKPTFEGMIATGDTGWLDRTGRLFIDGRADNMIVSGGENVFPEEVELVLSRMDGIADAVVVAVADQDFGQRLRAFIVAQGPTPPAEDAIRSYIAHELSRSRVPRDVIFVGAIPRSATGKVTRSVLDELAATAGLEDSSAPGSAAPISAR